MRYTITPPRTDLPALLLSCDSPDLFPSPELSEFAFSEVFDSGFPSFAAVLVVVERRHL